MREFEFRVWNKKRNLMLYPVEGSKGYVSGKDKPIYSHCAHHTQGTIFELTLDGKIFENNCCGYKGFNEDDVLQQFTGLKDKNGKKIFEGDIVKECHFEDWGDKDGYEYLGVVRHKTYQDGIGNSFSCFVTYPNLEENSQYSGNLIKTDTEVVGNIFENGDLIK